MGTTKNCVIGNIYRTTDYSLFKRLEGNRPILNARKNKVKASIQTNGYIMSPLCVNEHYQVVDGQARFEVEKELGLPVDYYIVPGAGINECITMNIYGTRWTVQDYIDSYAEQGMMGYIRFKGLQSEFPKCSHALIHFAAKGTTLCNRYISAGKLDVSTDECIKARDLLSEYQPFTSVVKKMKGSKINAAVGLVFIIGCGGVDLSRLLHKLEADQIPTIGRVTDALRIFSEVYNSRSKKACVSWDTDYLNFLKGKYPWYEGKYMNKE